MKLPTLYKKAKSGKIQCWCVAAEDGNIIVDHGQLDGKMQHSSKPAKGKNIGKANETTPEQQAELQIQSMWKLKKDKGYFESIQDADNKIVVLPMLAQDLRNASDKRKKYLFEETEYFYSQPKLDGVRCTASKVNGEIELKSRGGHPYYVKHIQDELKDTVPEGWHRDGELYIHGLPRQDIAALVKKHRDEPYEDTGYTSGDLEFWIYDTFDINDLEVSFDERYIEQFLGSFIDQKNHIKTVETNLHTSEEGFVLAQCGYVSRGFEGSILRMAEGPYELAKKSKYLMKYKDFMDDEFEIVGFTDGEGKDAGCVMWTCRLPNGGTVDVTPKGSKPQRRVLFKEGQKHIGKLLNVKFQGWTNAGSLEFPTGMGFRSEEDL